MHIREIIFEGIIFIIVGNMINFLVKPPGHWFTVHWIPSDLFKSIKKYPLTPVTFEFIFQTKTVLLSFFFGENLLAYASKFSNLVIFF